MLCVNLTGCACSPVVLIKFVLWLVLLNFVEFLVQDTVVTDDNASYGDDAGGVQMVQVQKKGTILEKSLGKLKETTMV